MNQLVTAVDMWVQCNGLLSSLTVPVVPVDWDPVWSLRASGPDVAPLLAFVALLVRVEMQGDVGGDMTVRERCTGSSSDGVAGVKMVTDSGFKFVEVFMLLLLFSERFDCAFGK